MPTVRESPKARWSTATLLSGGLAGVLGGVFLGQWIAGENSTAGLRPAPSAITIAAAPSSPPADSSRPPASDFEPRWARSTALPSSLTRDEDRARLLETLAARDPARAIAIALAETNLPLRHNLLSAALRGWVRIAPDDAARWTLQRPLAERSFAAAALFAGLSGTPALALELGARFVREDPALAHDHGCSLVFALARVGEFDAATRFAGAGPTANRQAWLATAFTLWAEHQPENAVSAAVALADPALRTEAFHSAVAGWTATNPSALAEFSARLTSDADRAYALKSALGEWVNQDLVAASSWLNLRDSSTELDVGAVAVATCAPLVARRPEVALSWAESVVDVELRSGTIAAVLREWAKTAPADARRYAETSPNLRATDRSAVLTDFGAPPSS